MDLGLVRGPQEGVLSIGSQRYLLIRPETLAPLGACARPEVHELLFAGGAAGGAAAARGALSDGWCGREAFQRLLAFGAAIGWGGFTLVSWEPARVEVTLTDSAFAQTAAGAPGPVCHTVRGVLSGMVSTLRGVHHGSRETGCRAAGAGCCTFELRPTGPREARG